MVYGWDPVICVLKRVKERRGVWENTFSCNLSRDTCEILLKQMPVILIWLFFGEL